MDDYFKIGIIVNTHGVKGEVKAIPTTDEVERFYDLKSVGIWQNETLINYNIERIRLWKQFVILKLEGIDDMTSAELLKQAEIRIDAALALPLSQDEYYIRDLYGMSVYTNTGEFLGELNDILQTGANDVYSVKNSDGCVILIPAIKQCIISVDVPGKQMMVKLMDGLI